MADLGGYEGDWQAPLLGLPDLPGRLFGEAVEGFAQQFSASQKQTEAFRHILPLRPLLFSTPPRRLQPFRLLVAEGARLWPPPPLQLGPSSSLHNAAAWSWPLQSVELKFLSLKTVLLTALASVKRVGDLQAFSVDDSCLEFGPADSQVVLRSRPGYVPKVPTTPFKDQVVNLQALPRKEADPAIALLCALLLLLSSVPCGEPCWSSSRTLGSQAWRSARRQVQHSCVCPRSALVLG